MIFLFVWKFLDLLAIKIHIERMQQRFGGVNQIFGSVGKFIGTVIFNGKLSTISEQSVSILLSLFLKVLP